MSVTMDDSIKRWTAKRKTALVVEILQGKTTVAEASRALDLSPTKAAPKVGLDLWRICAAPSARLCHLAFEGQVAFASQC